MPSSSDSTFLHSPQHVMQVTLNAQTNADTRPTSSAWSDSTDSDAEGENDESPADEAASRWGMNRTYSKAAEQAQAFYHSVVPHTLHEQLQNDPASRGLLILVAGMTFTADNDPNIKRPADAQPSASRELLAADLHYLVNSRDPALLSDCQAAANSAVDQCGDRVSYGATQLHQLVEAHQFKSGVLSAKVLFEGLARHFNQSLVEAQAEKMARPDDSDESIEYYHDLAAKVAKTGRPLVETSTDNLYSRMYAVTDEQLQETLNLIDTKNSNPAYLETFNAHQATVNEVLRTVFESDFNTMIARRSTLEEQESDTLLDPEKSSTEQLEAGVRLGELGQMESAWYGAKLQELLNKPELLK